MNNYGNNVNNIYLGNTREVNIESIEYSGGILTSISKFFPIANAINRISAASTQAEAGLRLLEQQNQNLSLTGNLASGSGLTDHVRTKKLIDEATKANNQAIAVLSLNTQAQKAEVIYPEIIIGDTISNLYYLIQWFAQGS